MDEDTKRVIVDALVGAVGGSQATHPESEDRWPMSRCHWLGGGYSEKWTKAVADAPWHERKTTDEYVDWYKQLACPRCGHPMTVLVAPGVMPSKYESIRDHALVVARCNCRQLHTDRPEKQLGCGYGGYVPAPEVTR
jgi:hypothetical protein